MPSAMISHAPTTAGLHPSDAAISPALAVERAEQLAHVDDLCLELDHEERAPAGVPREKVDNAALAVDPKGHLGPHAPARIAGESFQDRFRQSGMSSTGDPVEIAGSRSRLDVQSHLKYGRDSTDDPERQRIEVAALDA